MAETIITAGPDGRQFFLVYELEQRAYPVRPDGIAIGRDVANDIVVGEPTVSRVHAKLRRNEGGAVIENVGATGTRVNGAAVADPRFLVAGDRVEVGTALFTFRRGPLPLSISVVDRVRTGPVDEIASRRDTIKNPLLPPHADFSSRRLSRGWIVLVVLVIVLALALVLFRV